MHKKGILLAVLVVGVGLHSLIIGLSLLWLGKDIFSLFGWVPDCHPFFLHQVGIFHIVLAVIYIGEYFRFKGVTTIIFAKSTAVVFLLAEFIFVTHESPILLAAIGDGIIAVIVALSYHHFRKSS